MFFEPSARPSPMPLHCKNRYFFSQLDEEVFFSNFIQFSRQVWREEQQGWISQGDSYNIPKTRRMLGRFGEYLINSGIIAW